MATTNSYSFRPSENEKVSKTVLIALGGTTGSGKTESAMRLARGIVGDSGKFCVIDTENKRALNKKGRYHFDHLDLKAPYSPDNFKGAIDAAIKAGYGAIIVDSFSHEWFGEGGCSDMQEEILERLSKGDPAKAERLTALAWKQPKQSHKKLMYRILQSDIPIIFCLRAEPKIKFQKDKDGKTQVVDAGWQPICEKMFGYEMLVYALLMPENPGIPVHLKKLEPEFEQMFPIGKQISEECGKLVAAWAKDGATPKFISDEQRREIVAAMGATIKPADLLKQFNVKNSKEIPADRFEEVMIWIAGQKPAEAPEACPLCQQTGGHSPSCPDNEPSLL